MSDPLPAAVLRCLRSGSSPLAVEIDQVATRMWSEIEPGREPWREVDRRSAEGRRVLRLARGALGLAPMPDVYRNASEE